MADTPFGDVFEGMPEAVKTFSREGFRVLSGLSDQQLNALISYVFKIFHQGGGETDTEELAEILQIQPRDARTLSSAVAFAVGAVASGEDTARMIASAQKAELLPTGSERALQYLITGLDPQRSLFKDTIKEARLASEIVPAFENLETTIDLRMSFDKDRIVSGIPVVLAYITTDDTEARIWFQMRKRDVKLLATRFEKLYKQIEEAERWAVE